MNVSINGWKPESQLPTGVLERLSMQPFASAREAMGKLGVSTDNLYVIEDRVERLDQWGEGSCFCEATLDAYEALMPEPVKLSRNFLYYNERLLAGDVDKDDGGYISLACQSVQDHGVCRETLWPYDPARMFERPPLAAYEEAYDHRVGYSPLLGARTSYFRITAGSTVRGDDVESSVRAKHPVIVGLEVGQPFVDYFVNGTGPDWQFGPPARPIGGHAMTIRGVRRTSTGARLFLARNWWGNGGLAAFPGHAWINEAWLATASDITVPTIAPELVQLASTSTLRALLSSVS